MDISKVSLDEKVKICRKYFLIGIFGLPLVWLTNVIWFGQEALCSPPSPGRSSIRRYVFMSLLGVLFWTFVLVFWEVYFQGYRSQGLAWADYISFTFPSGRV